MDTIQISSRIASNALLLRFFGASSEVSPIIEDLTGKRVDCPVLSRKCLPDGGSELLLDASQLAHWSPSNPVLYCLRAGEQYIEFGHVEIEVGQKTIKVNGADFYARGYIRGITAHEHPNLLGVDDREYYRKNIRQAKRYGFNLVRFHSTIPDEAFIEEADRLGLFVHLELGFGYAYDEHGNKTKILFDEERWRKALIQLRNHPSVFIICLGNEMHRTSDYPDVAKMIAIGRELAPGKLIMDNSGWGEYDREISDVFIQHVAYFFPFKKHGDMFLTDNCWEMDGSVHGPDLRGDGLKSEREMPIAKVKVRRALEPIRPVLAHECLHYIEMADYEALSRRFDEFAARVGPEYLKERGIEKPSYMTRIPEIIREKKLEAKLPDYCRASEHFKKVAYKVYLERLRLSPRYCGYEMLQFADNLKYENRNGIVDIFDDDKFIDAEWMRRFNDDVVLLADFPKENFFCGETFSLPLYLSQFDPTFPRIGKLRLVLIDKDGGEHELFVAEKISVLSGLNKLLDIEITPKAEVPSQYGLRAELDCSGRRVVNDWKFWTYPRYGGIKRVPLIRTRDGDLQQAWLSVLGDARPDRNLVLTDVLDDQALEDLKEGKTVVVAYHVDRPGQPYRLPGAKDRFKPCIWDRGHNLGGYIQSPAIERALASGRYFDLNVYSLVEEAYKINLDVFPFAVNEWVCGVDKPVRDRMDALIKGIKEIRPEHVLRNFSYLFSLSVGAGTLVLCGFNLSEVGRDPAASSFLAGLISEIDSLKATERVSFEAFKQFLDAQNAKEPLEEGVMNRFWQLDDRPVEDKLFWEEAKIDFRKHR